MTLALSAAPVAGDSKARFSLEKFVVSHTYVLCMPCRLLAASYKDKPLYVTFPKSHRFERS